MPARDGLARYRVARRAWELEQVHRLNRDVFALEVGQHAAQGERLVDRFHAENTYLVAVAGRRVVGMLAVRDRRPFSLDEKIDDLDARLPAGLRVCEVRLLAVARDHRRGKILPGLLRALWRLGRLRAYDAAVLSAYAQRVGLYERLGCVRLGPAVVRGGIEFQPMIATRDRFAAALAALGSPRARPRPTVYNFLPGPVRIAAATRRALGAPAGSHRAPAFHALLGAVKAKLLALSRAPHVEILLGSGTLGNDLVAAQLELAPGRGLVLANGEFGDRLAGHARRHRLEHDVLRAPWGGALAHADVERAVAERGYAWIWFVHCETSTGVLNDLDALGAAARRQGARVCVDCISSLGTVPVDLAQVDFATGVSGKALRAFPGLALVFYRQPVAPQPDRLPSYLDLGTYAATGVAYTHSSNLLGALAEALRGLDPERRFAEIRRAADFLGPRLRAQGFGVLAPPAHASPAVFTLLPPAGLTAHDLGTRLARRGFLLSHESAYLAERNWIQVCLMGETRPAALRALLAALGDRLASAAA